jgi:hypothetical protein
MKAKTLRRYVALIECDECKWQIQVGQRFHAPSEIEACQNCGWKMRAMVLFDDFGVLRSLQYHPAEWPELVVHIRWYWNGQKKLQGRSCPWKGNDGIETTWWKNGQMESEANWKDGKREGLERRWYITGQKESEANWKDGKLMSAKVWKTNGEKCLVTKIDEEGNGIMVRYLSDETERYRSTYKNGEIV